MSTKQVLFGPEDETAAYAYSDWCDENAGNPALVPWAVQQVDNQGPWFLRQDSNGNWVVPLLGPPFVFGGVVFEEPEGGPEARATGVVVDTVTWPDEE